MKKTSFVFLLLILSNSATLPLQAQNKTIDSLQVLLKNANEDTTRLRLYLKLCEVCDIKDNLNYAEPAINLTDKLLAANKYDKQKSFIEAQKALANEFIDVYYREFEAAGSIKYLKYYEKRFRFYKQHKDLDGEVNSLINIAEHYRIVGNSMEQLETLKYGLSLSKEKNFLSGLSKFIFRIGFLYADQGDTIQALDYFKRGIKLKKEVGDTAGIARGIFQMANFYHLIRNYDKALEYFNYSLSYYEALKNKVEITKVYLQIGLTYRSKGDLTKSLSNLEKCLSIAKENDFKNAIYYALLGIGSIYELQGDFKKAIEYHQSTLSFAKKNNAVDEIMSSSYSALAKDYLGLNNFSKAKLYSDRFLNIGNTRIDAGDIRDAEKFASTIDSSMGNCSEAFKHYQKYIVLRDKLNDGEVHKAAQREKFQSEYEKQTTADKAEQEKKDTITKEENHKQKIVRNSFVGGFAFMLLLAGVSYRSFKRKQKDNVIITKQKELVEEKNQLITDNVNYAFRIQQAILPDINLIYKALEQSFILYMPKDIVSGDFYGFAQKNNRVIIASADCTGHGVSGAFMSMIGSSLLNQIINEKGITQPSEILNHLNASVIEALKQSDNDSHDGMDIAICAFDLEKNELQYAGAYRPLWIIRNKELITIKADKYPIGGLQLERKDSFTNHIVQLQKNDSIYIFSDGYADQFGGEHGQKLMQKNFKTLLLSIQNMDMRAQEVHLKNYFETWRGVHEQVDDVQVIGIRV